MKVIDDFSKLITCPDAVAYKSSKCVNVTASFSAALQKIIVSFAKHNVATEGADGATWTLWIWPTSSARAIRAMKDSTTQINK